MTAVQPEAPARVTPTGVLVYNGPPHTDEWFAGRRAGITATDLPAIVEAYEPGYRWARTPMHVWLDKRGELPDDGGLSHFAEAGIRAEPMIAQWWSDDHSVPVRTVGVLARAGEEWMRCSPDRLVDVCPDGDGPCGLQVKNRHAWAAGKWRDDVPDDTLAQVGWEMAVTGWGHIHVAALIGGNTPVWHRVDRDETLEDFLIGEAARLWACVLAGEPPAVDASAALARLLDAVHADRDGGQVIDQQVAADLYRRYRLGAALEKRGKALKAACRDEAIVALDSAEELWVPGQAKPLVTYRAGAAQDAIPADELRRLKAERPDVYAALVEGGFITTGSHRTLRWAKRVGEAINE